MENIFSLIKSAWESLFNTPLGEMTAIHLLLLVGLSLAAFFLLKYIWKFIKKGFKTIWNLLKMLSPKYRCSKIQCRTCGRSLDRCVCSKNRKKGYMGRLLAHSSEKRLIKKRIASNKKK